MNFTFGCTWWYAAISAVRIGCSALEPDPIRVVAPTLAGIARAGTTTARAANILVRDVNSFPFFRFRRRLNAAILI
jgi:hypothetical protein